ncbi:MAG: hypothetical protein HRU29_09525 [Rhizobiales bacterium]|nr:hypothetical protein [Hyphomicrobiales bacterium]NRB14629.1 hypothetical protein [Hyphomicrobiales bacterium]
MEYLGIFGLFGFLLAAQLYTEVKKLKTKTDELELKLIQLLNKEGA